MRYAILLPAVLLAGPVLAQTPPPPPATPSQPPGDATRPPPPPPPMRGRGAFIKLEGPQGATIAVRCADGEPTKACADIVTDLLDKVRSTMRPERWRGDDQNWRRDDRRRRDDD